MHDRALLAPYWHASRTDEFCDAVRARRRTSDAWLLPVHVSARVRRTREDRFDAHVAQHGDVESQMLAAGVDPNDEVAWAREVRQRQQALDRPAQRELASTSRRHPSNGGVRRG